MKAILSLLLVLPVLLSSLSCSDQGAVVEYLEILSTTPKSNSLGIDKIQPVILQFTSPIERNGRAKIMLRYLDDNGPIRDAYDCEECPEHSETVSLRPVVWKAGRTVEVLVPNTVTDIHGRSLRTHLSFRFTVAADSLPFRLIETNPRSGDTVSIGGDRRTVGMSLIFNDYVVSRYPPQISILPTATLVQIFSIPMGPSPTMHFSVSQLQPYSRYEVIIPSEVYDYEGETLTGEHRLVFYTKP